MADLPNPREESSNSVNQELLESLKAMMLDMKTELENIKAEKHRKSTHPSESEMYYSSSKSHHSRRRARREDQEFRPPQIQTRDPLAGLKIKIPSFLGTTDPEEYLEWEKKIEMIFDCRDYTTESRLKVAPTSFKEYALSWWDQLVTSRKRVGDLPIDSWAQMKIIMRKRFIPSHYHRELHFKLRNLTQGSKTVEEYYKELETLLLRADLREDNEAAMARFMGGLNRDLIDRLEVHHYVELDELLHKAIMFEKQLKRKNFRANSSASRFPPRDEKSSKDYKPFPRPKTEDTKLKGIETGSSTKTRNIQCFKCKGYGHYSRECTNKRVIVIRANGDVESEDEHSENESVEETVNMPQAGQLLVTRRTLNVQTKTDENEQRENLFHTRCLVHDKICSLVIDGGSCTNVASQTMVTKLGLQVTKRPNPYKLQWLNDEGELEVTNQVLVPLAIGKYVDEILCDVLPMDAGHILLGRPWQSDRRVLHDGFTNRYSFDFLGKKHVLVPLTPQEVHLDQLALKRNKVTKPEPKTPTDPSKTLPKPTSRQSTNLLIQANPGMQMPHLLIIYKECFHTAQSVSDLPHLI